MGGSLLTPAASSKPPGQSARRWSQARPSPCMILEAQCGTRLAHARESCAIGADWEDLPFVLGSLLTPAASSKPPGPSARRWSQARSPLVHI